MPERVDHPTLVWRCLLCGAETPLNMAHPRVAAGLWKPGSRIDAMCKACGRDRVPLPAM